MPGLPRKSTANQFKKLMRKSGKSRTNKAAGATDPSTRKIATYEQYFAMKENAHEDIDPYGEENWNEVDVKSKAKEIMDWFLQNQPFQIIGYELMISDEIPIGMELLEIDEDGTLVENQDFYYGMFFNDREEGWVNYRSRTSDKYKSLISGNYYINIGGDDYKQRAFNDFVRVIGAIKYHKNPPKKSPFSTKKFMKHINGFF